MVQGRSIEVLCHGHKAHGVELGWRRMAVGMCELGWTMKEASGVLGVEERNFRRLGGAL